MNWPQTTPFEENGALCKPDGIIDDLTVEYWFIQNDVQHHPNANDIFAVKRPQKIYFYPRRGFRREIFQKSVCIAGDIPQQRLMAIMKSIFIHISPEELA